MAIRLITNIKTFVGLSGDAKPTDVPAGSRFFETDTQLGFIFDGRIYVADEKIDSAATTNILLAAILTALNINNAQLSIITGEELDESDVEEAV